MKLESYSTAQQDLRVPAGNGALAAITFQPDGGGVAYVARLLQQALSAPGVRPPWTLALDPANAGRVKPFEAARFGARLLVGSAIRRPDWIIYNHPGIARAETRLPAFLARPYVVQCHGIEVWDTDMTESQKMALRGACLRIAPSSFTASQAAEINPDIGPLTVCPHGLLPESVTAAADGKALVDTELISRVRSNSVLIIGRLWSKERYKGHDQLLECWPQVREAVPDAQLLIAGRGDDSARLQEKAATLGLGDSVIFCGFVSDATRDALLQRVAVFAMPSKGEGFGIVYLEAMKLGIPCIGALEDGASEPIVDGETGYLVEQSDLNSLGAALISILTDKSRQRTLGEAGRRRYEQLFTFERYQSRVLDLIASAVESK